MNAHGAHFMNIKGHLVGVICNSQQFLFWCMSKNQGWQKWHLPGNTGKYDLQHWNFYILISIPHPPEIAETLTIFQQVLPRSFLEAGGKILVKCPHTAGLKRMVESLLQIHIHTISFGFGFSLSVVTILTFSYFSYGRYWVKSCSFASLATTKVADIINQQSSFMCEKYMTHSFVCNFLCQLSIWVSPVAQW